MNYVNLTMYALVLVVMLIGALVSTATHHYLFATFCLIVGGVGVLLYRREVLTQLCDSNKALYQKWSMRVFLPLALIYTMSSIVNGSVAMATANGAHLIVTFANIFCTVVCWYVFIKA